MAAAQTKLVDAELQVGSTSTSIEVSAEAPRIQSEAPVRGGTIAIPSVLGLPIATQNPVSLALTLPGVSTNRYSFGVSTFSVNGARPVEQLSPSAIQATQVNQYFFILPESHLLFA